MKQWEIGEIRNGFPVLPANQRKQMLLLSDDLRMNSGVGTVSREIVLGTMHRYNWIQVGGAIKHPDEGKVFNLDAELAKTYGIPEPSLTIYPISGYGNPDVIRQLLDRHKIKGVLHYTDPRFWEWLYQMEHELRQEVPLMYYNIWDDLPYPQWNEFFYESCDLIMNISRQTANIVKNVWTKNPPKDWQVTYVPHGMNENDLYPIDELHSEWEELQNTKQALFGSKEYDFVVFYNARNIRRKSIQDMMYAYKSFCDTLAKEQADRCVFVMHTQPIDGNGTDIQAVKDALLSEYNVIISNKKVDNKKLNHMYNIADVQILISSNEGFGLSGAEALMVGTPIIVNSTGGMQDYCGFKKEDGTYLTLDDYTAEWGSNHDGRYKKCGNWVKPVFPTNRSIQGSPVTPYIADDRCDWQDVAIRLLEWYETPSEIREEYGIEGREFVLDPEIGMAGSEMCRRFIQDMDKCFENWTPKKRFTIYNTSTQENKKGWNGLTLNKEIKSGALGY